jgi:hypothetical protein
VSILEGGPLDPFPFNEIAFAIREFEDLNFPLAVLAIKFECDPIFEPLEPRSGPRIKRGRASLEPPISG